MGATIQEESLSLCVLISSNKQSLCFLDEKRGACPRLSLSSTITSIHASSSPLRIIIGHGQTQRSNFTLGTCICVYMYIKVVK